MVSTAMLALTALSLTTAPLAGGPLTRTTVPVNATAGLDQFDPHVDGDLAAYSEDNQAGSATIRYYRFSNGVDLAVPSQAGAIDLLSDVNQGRVVFTRSFGGTNSIWLLDTNVASASPEEIDPSPGSNRIGVALGANSLFYADFGIATGADMMLVDLSTAARTVTRITNDLLLDQNPGVSPDGNALVWEKCPTPNIFNCEVMQAVRTGSTWTQSVVAPAPSGNPDTNGTLVVYEGTRTGSLTGQDIYLRPLAGGPEAPLEIPGPQYNPSIRGSVMAFESRVDAFSNSDLFLYDVATNRLFQLTATVDVNETLNDVTVLANGDVRVVWTANDEVDGVTRNVYGSTFALPAPGPTCQARTATLQATKTYSPSRWTDADVTFATPFTFALPTEIPVTAGNSGNHWVTMTLYLSGGCETKCRYRGGSSQAHPQGATQLGLATRYVFDFCTGRGMGLAAGSAVQVDRVKLHLDNGDSYRPMTRVEVTLTEACGATAAAVCGGGSGGGHHDDDDDDDDDNDDDDGDDDDDDDDGHHGGTCSRGQGGSSTSSGHGHSERGGKHGHGHRRNKAGQASDIGTVTQALDVPEPEPVPAVGCSSTSGGASWLALAALLGAVALRRRAVAFPVAQRPRIRR